MKLPQLNERIFVIPSGGSRLTSRVEGSRGGDTVLLAPPSAQGRVVGLQQGEGVAIEWTTGRGLFRGEGVVMGPSVDGVPTVAVRLDASKIAQRREHVRVDLVLDAELRQTAGIFVPCNTIDVSGGGMRVYAPLDCVPGERVDFRLFLPDDVVISGDADVIRGTEGTGYALRFVTVEPAAREKLIRHVFAEHRREFASVRRA